MRVRGLWPYLPDFVDRAISLPIPWQDWIVDAPGGDGGGSGDGGDDRGDGDEGESENVDLSLTTVLKAGDSGS